MAYCSITFYHWRTQLFIVSLVVLALFNTTVSSQARNYEGWKAGVASVVITPDQPTCMAGYAFRNHPSQGKIMDLWSKALVLEDEDGKKVVIVTADLVGIPKKLSDHIRDQLKARFNLSRSQIIINTSHTHTGPVLSDALVSIYPINSSQQIINLVGKAIVSMHPVQFYAGNGVARFQLNRRNSNESTLSRQTELNGLNDYAVPVIKVLGTGGKLIAIVFGYACHNTGLSGYEFSGDYAGFAQMELSKYAEISSGYQRQWANNLLKKIELGDSLIVSYPYPVEVWRLGDQPIIILGGEVVIEYAIKLKRIFSQDTFILGYSNDVMAYIPTAAILRESGYEGATSQMAYGLPATGKASVETIILQEVLQLAKQVGVPVSESKLIN